MEHSLHARILSSGTQEKLLGLRNEQGDLGQRTDQEATALLKMPQEMS